MTHVFVSYVRDNQSEVDRLCIAMRRHGVRLWLDRNEIAPGERWQDAICDAIRDGAFFLACFSAEYTERTKSYMNEELELAIEEIRQRPHNRAFFIPVILTRTEVPDKRINSRETLRSLQWVDLTDDWDGGVAKVIKVVASAKQLPFESITEAFDRLQEFEDDIKAKNPDILSIAFDKRFVDGVQLDDWCVRVYVTQKVPRRRAKHPIPNTILGLPVDVVIRE